MRRWSLWVLLLGALGGLSAQEWRVVVRAPTAQSSHSWAQQAPMIPLQAALQKAGTTVAAGQSEIGQLFLTAQVYANDTLVDRVTMWDDGTHGDEQAGDGVYTVLYRPPRPENYRVRMRAQAEFRRDGKLVKREFWSDFVPFEVLVIPYARLMQPEPGSTIPAQSTARARLLLGESPYTGQDDTLAALLRLEGDGWQREVPMRRSETLLTAPLNLPKSGAYRLTAIVRVQRGGQTLQSQSESVQVEATTLSYFWLGVGSALLFIYLLLPLRQPPLRYRHILRFGNETHHLEPGQSLTVRGIQLHASNSTREVTLRTTSGSGATLRKGGQSVRLPEVVLQEGEQCLAETETIRYQRAEPIRATAPLWSRLLPTTPMRALFLLAGVGALGYWWYLWQQFMQ
ncbi:MAG: choice-of-anchor X domain-containing protein [Fimbriimonadales bacterium]